MNKKQCGIKRCKEVSNVYLYGGFALCPKHVEICSRVFQERSKIKHKSKGIGDTLNQIIEGIELYEKR